MKKAKPIAYWVTTILVSVGMAGSGLAQIIGDQGMVDIVKSLDYPLYFLKIIGAWKILGVIAILVPGFKLLKEWAYAGLFFTMTGAVFSHIAAGHSYLEIIGPFMQTIFITTSWYLRPEHRKLEII